MSGQNIELGIFVEFKTEVWLASFCRYKIKPSLSSMKCIWYSLGSPSLQIRHLLLKHPSLLWYREGPRLQYLQAVPRYLSARRFPVPQGVPWFQCSRICKFQYTLYRPETNTLITHQGFCTCWQMITRNCKVKTFRTKLALICFIMNSTRKFPVKSDDKSEVVHNKTHCIEKCNNAAYKN